MQSLPLTGRSFTCVSSNTVKISNGENDMHIRLALIVFIIFCSCTFAFSFEEITGFQQYKLGMSEDEFKKIANFTKSKKEGNGKTRYYLPSSVVQGLDYHTSVITLNGKVVHIGLSNFKDTKESEDCESRFDEIFGMVKAKYGPPAIPPEKKVRYTAMMTVRFIGKSGNSINISSASDLYSRIINVEYDVFKASASF